MAEIQEELYKIEYGEQEKRDGESSREKKYQKSKARKRCNNIICLNKYNVFFDSHYGNICKLK